MRVAAIDLGTVSSRLLLAGVEGGAIVQSSKVTEITDLGQGVDATGRLSEAAIGRVLAACAGFVRRIDDFAPDAVCTTLTSAARDAENGATLIEGLEQLGLRPQVIPGEVEARLRLINERAVRGMVSTGRGRIRHEVEEPRRQDDSDTIRSGDLVINTAGYSATLNGKPLNLAYKEFELLRYLVEHPGRVFTRAQLLQEVWGYDYYGGTRTVDVHVRRLRAKLGTEYENLIGTVRNVGYRYDLPKKR